MAAVLVAVFVFGLVHSHPSVAGVIVTSAKSHLPVSAVIVRVDDNANANDGVWGAVVRRHRDVVALLVQRGIDNKRRFNGGKTALMLANERGFKDIAAVLASGELHK